MLANMVAAGLRSRVAQVLVHGETLDGRGQFGIVEVRAKPDQRVRPGNADSESLALAISGSPCARQSSASPRRFAARHTAKLNGGIGGAQVALDRRRRRRSQ